MEELININTMFQPIQDTIFVVIYIRLQNKCPFVKMIIDLTTNKMIRIT